MRSCSKSDSREPSRRLPVCAVLILMLLAFTEGRSDIVRLKSGRTINGQVRGEEDGLLIVRTLTGQEKIPSGEIAGIEVGYTGLSFCVLHNNEKPKDCNGVLHLIQKESVVLGTGEALTQRKELYRGDFLRVEFRKAADGQQILPVLTTGIELEVLVKNGKSEGEDTLKGTVMESGRNAMILKLADGSLRTFKELDLIGGAFTPLPLKAPGRSTALMKLIPGAYQFSEGRWIKGSLFTIGYMGAAAGFAVAYSRSRAAERDASHSVSYWLVYDQQYQARFRYYQNVQRAIGAAAVLMYGLHLLDVFWGRSSDATAEAIFFPPVLSYGSSGKHSIRSESDQVEIVRFGFRF